MAADFWEETAFTAWSDKEVEKMLTDSPWAKQQKIVLGTFSEAPAQQLAPGTAWVPGRPPEPLPRVDPETGELLWTDNGASTPGASLGGPRAATVVLAGGAQFAGIRRVKVTVTWASALPIKQARLRQAIGRDPPVPPQARAALTQQDPLYAVTVAGLPLDFRELARIEDAIKTATRLERKNGEPIVLENVHLFEDSRDHTLTVVFFFPKTDAITLDDEEIELVTDLGRSPLKKKFKLADMVFHGQLTL